MNWLQKIMNKYSQTQDATSVLLKLLRNEIDLGQAVTLLMQFQDPKMCSYIATLLSDQSINTSFPDASNVLYAVGQEFNCFEHMQPTSTDPTDQTFNNNVEDMEPNLEQE